MASEKQIAANRRNAKKSSGPKTAKGKKSSRMNAFRHGFSARSAELAPRIVESRDCDARSEMKLQLTVAFYARLRRIEIERTKILTRVNRLKDLGNFSELTLVLQRAAALARYEERASAEHKRQAARLETSSSHQLPSAEQKPQ